MTVTTSDINNIYYVAFISRISFLLLSIVSNILILDHSSDSFSAPQLALQQFNVFDKIVWVFLGGLLRWDAQHFLHIASSGYTYENNLPFFPLFPVITKHTAFCVKYIFGFNITSSLLISSFILNCIFFIKAASTLYMLTLTAFKNHIFAYYSVLFFCISPATVFFIAPYSESLFSFCVFKGMLKYVQHKYWHALLWFSVSVLTRANGIINVGFILHLFYYYMLLSNFKSLKIIVKYFLFSFLSISCILFPFVVYQLYVYVHFCIANYKHSSEILHYAKENNLLLAGEGSVWCNYTVPFSYQYIQEHYWEVGFFRYYSIKQIPNFCLAFPITLLVFYYCGRYLYENWRLLFYADQIYKYEESSFSKISPSLFVFVVHIFYLTLFAVTNINVQVTTRLIASSSPLLYWIAAQEFIGPSEVRDKHIEELSFIKWIFYFNTKNRTGKIIKWYFISYAILGVVLFSNNFPWT